MDSNMRNDANLTGEEIENLTLDIEDALFCEEIFYKDELKEKN